MTSHPRNVVTSKRLLVINPNTNPAVTEQARLAAIAAASATTRIDAINPREGPFAVEGDADRATAAPRVASIIADTVTAPYDGYVLACFDDIGIVAGRTLVRAPVISMAEAAIRAAAASAHRFAIVTTVAAALPSISTLLRHYDVADRCAVAATGIGVAEAAARTHNAEEALLRTIHQLRRDGAETVILGSGAYAGRRQALMETLDFPFIDGLEAAISHCESAFR